MALFSNVATPFSWITLAVMLAIFAASVLMFVMLVQRWTTNRQRVDLIRWSRRSGFRFRAARREALPDALQDLIPSDSQVLLHLHDAAHELVQFQVAFPAPDAPLLKVHALVRRRAVAGPLAGLRPAAHACSLIDLLAMTRFASMTLGERFIVYAMDSRTARQLAESAVLALAPRDVGLILLENHIVLDFSSRPFDPIEFDRMISLSDQLARVMI